MKALGGALLVLVLVTGCSGAGPKPEPYPPRGDNTASAKATPEKGPLAFGRSYTWGRGITVTVSPPRTYKPSEFATVGKGPHHVVFTVTLVNKTGKVFDPAGVYYTAQSGNKEAEADYDEGIGDTPTTKLLDGRESRFKVGFAVKNPADIVFELSPDGGAEYRSALWQGEKP